MQSKTIVDMFAYCVLTTVLSFSYCTVNELRDTASKLIIIDMLAALSAQVDLELFSPALQSLLQF